MFGGDGDTLRSNGSGNQMYVVLQVVLTEKLWGTGSGASSLTNLENAARCSRQTGILHNRLYGGF